MEPKQILGMGKKTNSIGNQTKSIGNKSKGISNKSIGISNQTKSKGISNKSKSKGISNKGIGKSNQTKGKSNQTKGKINQTKGKSNQTKGKSNQTKGKSNQTKGKINQTKGKSKKMNRSLIGNMPDFNNASSEIKMSKQGLRKILKALFSDMGLEEKEIIRMLKDLGKDEESVQNLTTFINKTKKKDLQRKTDIIINMNQLKENILSIYKLFDELNNNLGILFERKKP